MEDKIRKLYYIPMPHSAQEYGEYKKEILDYLIKQKGEEVVMRTISMVREYWRAVTQWIKQAIKKGELDCLKLQIYVDSLPIGKEAEFAKMRIEKKIPYWLIIKRLMDKGAKLMGTEDIKLYQEEALELIKGIREKGSDSIYLQRATSQNLEKAYHLSQLSAKRDEFIAERINQTLSKENIGILFMGAMHKVTDKLAPDIEVVVPSVSDAWISF